MQQRTLAQPVTLTGIGLHSGQNVTLNLCPSDINSGIHFIRSDIAGAPRIAADAFLVKDTVMSSNLEVDNIKVGTVEHLLSAIAGIGIDNLRIKVSAAELPIMDGSAIAYTQCLLNAGIKEQAAAKPFMRILKPIRVTDGEKWAQIVPFNGYQLTFEIDFAHPAIPKETQQLHFCFSSQNFLAQISSARTFGFMKDIEYLQRHNLALGGSLDNAIVLDDERIMNTTGLRHPDEFVRHKILDAIGDLYLAKYSLIGHFSAYKSGHALNNQLVRALYADKNNFEIVTFDDKRLPPIDYSL